MSHPPDFTYEWESAPNGEVWDVWVWFAEPFLVGPDQLAQLVHGSQSAHDEAALEQVMDRFAGENDLTLTEFVSGTDTHRPMGDLVAVTLARGIAGRPS